MTEQTTTLNNLDIGKLQTIVKTVKENPELGRTMWRAQTRWLGGFQSEASIRGYTIKMDEPPDLAGTNTAPNMVEMVLGAYGCCLQTGYAMNAAVMGIPLEKNDDDKETYSHHARLLLDPAGGAGSDLRVQNSGHQRDLRRHPPVVSGAAFVDDAEHDGT